MSGTQAHRLLQEGLAHHQAGRLGPAQSSYEAGLRLEPRNADLLRLLGVLHLMKALPQKAVPLLQQACQLRPAFSEAWYSLGNGLQQLGRHDEALRAYQQALAANPRLVDAWCNRAQVLAGLGRVSEAVDCFQRALGVDQANLLALTHLSTLMRRQGRLQESLACAEKAVRGSPSSPDAYNALGLCLRALGRGDDAMAAYVRAIQLDGRFAEAYCNLGQLLVASGKPADALGLLETACALRQDYHEAALDLGNALLALGRRAEGRARFEAILARDPRHVQALNNLGVVAMEEGKPLEAEHCFRQLLQLQPDYADGLANLGRTLQTLGRPEESEPLLRRALELQPGHPEARNNLAIFLCQSGRLQEAETLLRGLLASHPGNSDARTNLGNVLVALGRHEEALSEYEEVLAARPDNHSARFNAGAIRLLTGDFKRGWPLYEARIAGDPSRVARHASRPRPDLGSSLQGRTVLLFAEQGLGDTLQFLRYAPLLRQRGARVLLEVQPALYPILEGWGGADGVCVQGAALPDYDAACPFLSLPLLFNTELASIPPAGPTLPVPEDRLAKWAARLPRAGAELRVGLVWAGNPKHQNDHNRSVPFRSLSSLLLTPGCRFFSLQKEKRAEDAAAMAAFPGLIDLGPELADFADTAAVIQQLDLVISVDTSVAHLAAVLAAPTWIPLPFSPDWRWLLDREDSPWYPCMRLFRQPAPGDWTPVLAALGESLLSLSEKETA
jgi:tetratricopeptide (TPR) repeat protein